MPDDADRGGGVGVSAVLEFDGATVGYRSGGRWLDAIRNVTLRIEPGQTYGLVGESGSGKSTLALAGLRYLPENGRLREGAVRLEGHDLYALDRSALRRLWRDRVALVPQDPLPSLNPSQTIGRQVQEALAPERRRRRAEGAALDRLAEVGLSDPERTAKRYPHELSGGQQQRVLIAMALAAEPALLVLDEPTTNLDVTTEAAILDLVADLVAERDTAVLFVSHSLSVVARVSDRVAVLYAGDLVEDAAVADLYGAPLHPYTRGLLDAVPTVAARVAGQRSDLRTIPGRLPDAAAPGAGCRFAPRCPVAIDACRSEHPPLVSVGGGRRSTRCIRWEAIDDRTIDPRQPLPEAFAPSDEARDDPALSVRSLSVTYTLPRDPIEVLRRRPPSAVRAVDGIDLDVPAGATVGLVGESGSGKSTLARAVIGLTEPSGGAIELFGASLAPALEQRQREALERMQMVFQSSDAALNPYRTVGETLRRPLERLLGVPRREADRRVLDLLERVKLDPAYVDRLPAQLSGGERQRVAIARAFASDPDVLLFDESVSGLDVSVQAAILNLLRALQGERGSAYLFISHDLGVVAHLADVVAVMYLGAIVEVGPTASVLAPPYHPYTEALLSAVPVPDPSHARGRVRLDGEVPSSVDVPSGCRFHTRCPRVLGDVCRSEAPPRQRLPGGGSFDCHIPADELAANQDTYFGPPGGARGGAAGGAPAGRNGAAGADPAGTRGPAAADGAASDG